MRYLLGILLLPTLLAAQNSQFGSTTGSGGFKGVGETGDMVTSAAYDSVELVEGTNITISRSGNQITITASLSGSGVWTRYAGGFVRSDVAGDAWHILDAVGDDSTTLALHATNGDLTITTTGGDISFDDENLVTTGTIQGATGIFDLLDPSGAVDLDFGSADVTDMLFTTDGGTVTIDGTFVGDLTGTADFADVSNDSTFRKNYSDSTGAFTAGSDFVFLERGPGKVTIEDSLVLDTDDIIYLDGGTNDGLYSAGNNNVTILTNGNIGGIFSDAQFHYGNNAYPAIQKEVSSASNPILNPARSDKTSGFGGAASAPALIVNGASYVTAAVGGVTLDQLTDNGLVTTNSGTGLLTVTIPGTGILTALGVNVGSAGAPVLFDGAGGTPSVIDLTNGTALPEAGVTFATNDGSRHDHVSADVTDFEIAVFNQSMIAHPPSWHIPFPDTLKSASTNGSDSVFVWRNGTGATVTVDSINAESDVDDYDFDVVMVGPDGEVVTLIDAVQCNVDRAENFDITETTISNSSIPNGYKVFIVPSTDNADFVAGSIYLSRSP